MKRILVLNPNSNESVTQGLAESVAEFGGISTVDVHCATLSDGPFGIETNEDIAAVIPLITAKVLASPVFDAFVIACYSDPGLAECREVCDKPVFGIQQSALETAIASGGRFGVLALSNESIERHVAYIRTLGYDEYLAGELPLDVTVDQAASDDDTLRKIVAQGRRLIEESGATVLILGCAGMATLRAEAEAELGVSVIEPTQATVRLAIAAFESILPARRYL